MIVKEQAPVGPLLFFLLLYLVYLRVFVFLSIPQRPYYTVVTIFIPYLFLLSRLKTHPFLNSSKKNSITYTTAMPPPQTKLITHFPIQQQRKEIFTSGHLITLICSSTWDQVAFWCSPAASISLSRKRRFRRVGI